MELTPEAKRLNIVFDEYHGSQESFATLMGVHQSHISRMLKGLTPVSQKVTKGVCYKLGYSPEWFIKGVLPKKTKPGKTKIITDISEFKIELKMAFLEIEKLKLKVKYLEDQADSKISKK